MNPLLRTKDGMPKIARWSYVPNEASVLFDQADYLCYALLQKYRDPNSMKARLCAPMLENGAEQIGKLMGREETRQAILCARFPDCL